MIVIQKVFSGKYGEIYKSHKYPTTATLSHVCKVKTEITA